MADPEDDDEGAPESPSEGATCSVHGERLALAVCPSCGKNACMQCWHQTIRRCHACLVRDAESIAPAIPWEDEKRGFVGRFFGTLATAFSPDTSAPGFARESSTNGWPFALLTFTPLALLCGIIPFTRTLVFGSSFEIRTMGSPSSDEITMDVAIAALVGLGVSLLVWAAVALPYVSLSRAYADRGQLSAPVRLMMYRGWLVPAFALLFTALPWAVPAASSEYASLLAMIPLVLLLAAMRSVARMGSGAGPIAAIGIIMVPFVLMQITTWIAISQIAPFMPDQAELEAAMNEPGPAPSAPEPSAPEPTAPTPSEPPAPAPTEATPTEAAPTEAVPTEAVPTEAAPREAVPTEAAPTEAAPTEAVPTEAAPAE